MIINKLYTALISKLQPLALPVLTVIPDNVKYPFIYLEVINVQDSKQSKTNFTYYGTVSVVIDYEINESISDAINMENRVHFALNPYRTATIMDGMSTWTLINRTGMFRVNETKIYRAILSFEFNISLPIDYFTRVKFDGGIIESPECIIYND